jgi:hypothetical protein
MAPLRDLVVALLAFQVKSVHGETNVYGKEMQPCGPDHGGGCTYAAMDAGAHQVCVTQLPHGFSSQTGQGPWSDQFEGQPWCICIWAYSNYILQNKDLPLKCESIPAKVLEEQYSLDKFKQCGSMSSTDGCGPEDIRRSIQSLCQQCDDQAGSDAGAKAALKSKCDAILQSAPPAPTSRLYAESIANAQGLSVAAKAKTFAGGVSPVSLGVFGFIVAGIAVGMIAYALRRGSSNDEAELAEEAEAVEDGIE